MTVRAGDAAPPAVIQESLQGKYSGFASRFTAFAVDMGVSLGVFMLALAAISFAAKVLTGKDITWNKGDIWVIIAYAAWAFAYFAYSWAASGRTAGMALFGVRVVRDDGTDASGRRAVARTLAFPLSFLFLGLGFTGILLGDRRRALHDVIAGTAVIYSWDAQAATAAVPVQKLISHPRPARAGSSSGLVRRLLGYRVGVLDGDPGAFRLYLTLRDADLEDALLVARGDVLGVHLAGQPEQPGERAVTEL